MSTGIGNTTSSASGQYMAKARATPRTAPDAPMKGLTAMKVERPRANTAAPVPQNR